MSPEVFAPLSPHVRVIRVHRERGRSSFVIRGLPKDRVRVVADRVRSGILNSGFSMPTGAIDVDVHPCVDEGAMAGLDLPLALAVLLAEPSREFMRQEGLVAWGAMNLDGSLRATDLPAMGNLPAEPWVGRFWYPTDHVPVLEEPAVLTIIDAADLECAWGLLLALRELERKLDAAVTVGSESDDCRRN